MNTKLCHKCQIEKPAEDFRKGAGGCRACVKLKQAAYYQKNKEKAIKASKTNRDANKDNIERKLKRNEYYKEYYEQNKEKVKAYYHAHREQRKAYERKYSIVRRSDAKYRIDQSMAHGIARDLKQNGLGKNGRAWSTILGYSREQLMERLASQFHTDPKICWSNYGSYWHIDHIKPRALFQYSSVEDPDFKACWALENLRPLEAGENMRKGAKYSDIVEEICA